MGALDMVLLRRDLAETRPEAEGIGKVVLAHAGGAGHEVEFATLARDILAVAIVSLEDLRFVATDEIAPARRVA